MLYQTCEQQEDAMKSISEIKREFEQTGELELPALFAQYESDARNV